MKKIFLFEAIFRIILITALISFIIVVNAQSIAVNTTGTPADESAILDVSSSSKGFLAPRMTTAQRTGIASPANGLMVFDTETKTYWYYSDSWKEITDLNGGSGFTLPYSGSFADLNKVFSIVNTSTSNSRVAIYGKGSNVFTGLIPSDPTGVWGEEDGGIGVMGTSIGKYGVFGSSQQSNGVYGFTIGTSAAVYGKSNNNQGIGVMGYIPNGGIAVSGENNGSTGSAGKFFISNANNNGSTADIYTFGTGRALMAQVLNTNSGAEAVTINTNGLGSALGANILNAASNANAASFITNGLGRGLYAKIANANSTSPAIYGLSNGTGTVVYAESTGGGTAVYGKTTKQNGAAIFGINNAGQGRAIQGSATGTDGVAIYGEGGNANSSSYAGFFRNTNAANTKDVVQIYNQGAGRGLMVDQVNASNTDDVIEVRNYGTGKFLSLTTGTGEIKTTISKNGQINTDGNIYTEGDLYVNGLKGIVRNTYSNQMRMEVMQLTIPGGFHFVVSGEFIAVQTVSFNFNTAFSSAPAVYRANCITPISNTSVEYLSYRIYDVTTTGFKIDISPSPNLDFTSTNTTFKFVAIGND